VKQTLNTVDRYAEMSRAKNRPCALVDGQLFTRREQWIAPIGPAGQAYRLDRHQCRDLLRKLGGLWVMWRDGLDSPSAGSDWYAVICRQHRAVEEISDGKRRSELRRALRECEVRKVDAGEVANQGYETYCTALQSHQKSPAALSSESEFSRRVMTDAPFGDLRHQWGVYCNGKMIAFAQNLIYDTVEVNYTNIKLHPQYLKYYPAYALIYRMNEYYLSQKGFQYVNDGFKSIVHETGIQEFLIRKFGFEKAYTGLHVHYRPPLGQLLQAVRPFRTAVTTLCPKTKALFELERLRLHPG
jgi:hypothetical protein